LTKQTSPTSWKTSLTHLLRDYVSYDFATIMADMIINIRINIFKYKII